MRNHTDILRKTAMDRMEETKQMTLRSTAADTSQLKLDCQSQTCSVQCFLAGQWTSWRLIMDKLVSV